MQCWVLSKCLLLEQGVTRTHVGANVCTLSQTGILHMIWTMVSAGQVSCSLLTYSLQVATGMISARVYMQAAAKESYKKGTALGAIVMTGKQAVC